MQFWDCNSAWYDGDKKLWKREPPYFMENRFSSSYSLNIMEYLYVKIIPCSIWIMILSFSECKIESCLHQLKHKLWLWSHEVFYRSFCMWIRSLFEEQQKSHGNHTDFFNSYTELLLETEQFWNDVFMNFRNLQMLLGK